MPKTPVNDEQISRFDFETQATRFDDRASLGPLVAERVAERVVERLGIVDDDVLVEIGAGTGEIGSELAKRARGYVGIDGSPAMLGVFRERTAPGTPTLLVADANAPWPVTAGTVRGVFLSRVLHHLNREHLIAELARLAHPSGLGVVLGRRVREASAPAARLRRELHGLLEELGYSPRKAEKDGTALIDTLLARGAARIAPEIVARRTLTTSYRIELDAWKNKGGLAGLALPSEVREAVLRDLEGWAVRDRGEDLDAKVDAAETYVIEGALIR